MAANHTKVTVSTRLTVILLLTFDSTRSDSSYSTSEFAANTRSLGNNYIDTTSTITAKHGKFGFNISDYQHSLNKSCAEKNGLSHEVGESTMRIAATANFSMTNAAEESSDSIKFLPNLIHEANVIARECNAGKEYKPSFAQEVNSALEDRYNHGMDYLYATTLDLSEGTKEKDDIIEAPTRWSRDRESGRRQPWRTSNLALWRRSKRSAVGLTAASSTGILDNDHENEVTSQGPAIIDSLGLRANDALSKYDNPAFGDTLDQKLTFTCRDKCGLEISFPCGCSPVCVVYGTCCDDMAHDCPHVLQEGLSRFGHLLGVELLCEEDSVSKITSCPVPVSPVDLESQQENATRETERMRESDNGNRSSSTMFGSVLSRVREDGHNTHVNDRFNHGTNDSSELTTTGTKFRKTAIDKINQALLLAAPITDAVSGFTFLNKSIYDCHGMPGASLYTWSLRLEYSYSTPLSLEDIEPLLKSNNVYVPTFNRQILTPHLCLPNAIQRCKSLTDFALLSEDDKGRCHNSTAVVISNAGMGATYANKFCAYCNEGRHNKLWLQTANTVNFRSYELQVLLSLPRTDHYSLNVVNVLGSPVSWLGAQCSVSDSKTPPHQPRHHESSFSVQTEQTECPAQCEGKDFTLSRDGMCKAHHMLLVALADNSLPLPATIESPLLTNFLSCGLKALSPGLRYADFHPATVTGAVSLDTRVNKTLRVFTLHMDLPTLISNKAEFVNIFNYVAILARSLKAYRISNSITESIHEEERMKTSVKTITSLSLSQELSYNSYRHLFINYTYQLRGSLVDGENTTTVCSGYIFEYRRRIESPRTLICTENSIFERDAEMIAAVSNSKCFDLLHDAATELNGCDSLSDGYKTLAWIEYLFISALSIILIYL